MSHDEPTTGAERVITHRDLLPRLLCPSLQLKHLLTHGLGERIYDDRQWPGDGYYWCARTCNCVGPDDEIVHPKDCQPGRPCCEIPQV